MKSDLLDVALLTRIVDTQSMLAKANFDVDIYMNLIVHEVQSLTKATGAVVELIEGHELVYKAASGSVSRYLNLRLDRKSSLSGLCVTTKEVLYVNDAHHDSRVNKEACKKVNARSLVVAPLIYSEELIGVLKIVSNKPKAFNEIHVQTLQIMAGFIASSLKQQLLFQAREQLLKENATIIKKLKKTQGRLSYLAHHDPLTGLPNRSLLNDTLKNAMAKIKRNHLLLALMYLDIDHFKYINDTYGHDMGDELLIAFSRRLKKCVRAYDLIVRLGGDEFILLIDDLQSKQDAIKIAKKIIKIAGEAYVFNKNTEIHVTNSVGISFYEGEVLHPHQLIKQADDALYAAKHSGKSTYKIFNELS